MSAIGFEPLNHAQANYFWSVAANHANRKRRRKQLVCNRCNEPDCRRWWDALSLLATAGLVDIAWPWQIPPSNSTPSPTNAATAGLQERESQQAQLAAGTWRVVRWTATEDRRWKVVAISEHPRGDLPAALGVAAQWTRDLANDIELGQSRVKIDLVKLPGKARLGANGSPPGGDGGVCPLSNCIPVRFGITLRRAVPSCRLVLAWIRGVGASPADQIGR
ncbi:MAG TPA: hypothetical protein DGT23_34285, partial [Micromonosporaceae bacterium]|nr:hypothetical protein [Micromonosporaceae bacterium]